MSVDTHTFWHRRARFTALRRNFAGWLAAFLPAAIAASALSAITLLILRQQQNVPTAFWPAAGLLFLAAAGFAYLRARREFFTLADARIHLEHTLGLHNRLTAAAAGVGPYPAVNSAPDGFTWQWSRILGALAVTLAILPLAAWIPVSTSNATFRPTTPPTSWTDLETWNERLAESEIVEPEALSALEEKLDALRDQPAEEWFSHSSLEAGDSLRNQTAQSLRALEQDLALAAAALDPLTNPAAPLSDPQLQQLQTHLDQALSGLELGTLPLNRELLQNLQSLDLSKARQLDPAQIAALRERLKQGATACAACVGVGESDKLANGLLFQPGDGGITRGPGTLPLSLKSQPTALDGTTPEQITNPDLSRALPGEVLAIGQSEPDPDAAPATLTPTAGGSIASPGQGGDAVWRDNLTPAEREVLQRFFN